MTSGDPVVTTASDQSCLTKGRIAAAHGRYSLQFMISFYSPQTVATVNTTKFTIENDLTKKKKKKKRKRKKEKNKKKQKKQK